MAQLCAAMAYLMCRTAHLVRFVLEGSTEEDMWDWEALSTNISAWERTVAGNTYQMIDNGSSSCGPKSGRSH